MTTPHTSPSPGEPTELGALADRVLAGMSMSLAPTTVIDAIADHVERSPAAPALHQIDQPTVSYAELWDHAARLAGTLTDAGVTAGDQVAVWATRSTPVVAAAIATMALGAAFLPIDPTYPAARVRRILEVGAPRAMVCADPGAVAGSLPRGVPTVDIHATGRPASPLRPLAGPEDVAYTVFTTGSTGLPKGVLVGHRALHNYLGWAQELTDFGSDDATPCFASLGFDHAVSCLWLPLFAGGSVQLVPESWDPRPWLAPRERPFSFIKITPSHVRLFERIAKPEYHAVTRTLMFGGERLDAALVASLGARIDGVRLLNHYGPTEATVGCTAHRFDIGSLPSEGALPIGVPCWNSRAYIVDEDLRPVAPGDEGELVLGGHCVADGYLGGSEVDRARFIDEVDVSGDLAIGGPRSRAYRTGDRTVLVDGEVQYRGRLDEQVKVRGHRIEIQEVHDLSVSVDGVAQAAIAILQTGLGGLELFVVPEDGAATTPDTSAKLVGRILEHLRAHLPAAAVPGKVLLVSELVANAHGKWDAEATRARVAHTAGSADAAHTAGSADAADEESTS